MKRKIALAVASVVASVVGLTPIAAAQAATPTVTVRYAGTDRYATAAQIAQHIPASGNAGRVFLATGEKWPDALAAGPAAAKLGAAVLLTRATQIPAVTMAELARRMPTQVVIVGGVTAISDAVTAQLQQLKPAPYVERIAGGDRYGTSALMAQTFFPGTTINGAWVAPGDAVTPALVAASRGAWRGDPGPLLLVPPTGAIPAGVLEQLRRTIKVRILGDTNPALTATTATIASQTGRQTLRYPQVDIYDLSAAVTADVTPGANSDSVSLATTNSYADALAGASLGRPLLFAQPNCVPRTMKASIERLGVSLVVLLGGANALDSRVEALQACAS